ncbi:MAG: hypothetical protein RL653_3553 [Pseudomonadota bacterium]|jgi:hypothetical protein
MEHKGKGTAVVTAERVKAGLKVATTTLEHEEERILRMRHGVSVDPKAPLARAAGNNEALADELLVMEMQLLKAWKARLQPAAAKATPVKSAAKDRMVRALKAKK